MVLRADIVIDPTPARVAVPIEGRTDGRLRASSALQQFHGLTRDGCLHVPVIGDAARIAEREVDEQETWDGTMLDDVPAGADDDGRDAVLFKMSGCQTHGLMADGSQGDEEGCVGAVRG